MSAFRMDSLRAALPSVGHRHSRVPTVSRPPRSPYVIQFEGMCSHSSLFGNGQELAHLGTVQNGAKVFAMRHGKRVKKLNKPADQRKALIRALVTEVLRHGKITTTVVRAKAIRPYVDKMIGLAKRGTLHARRQALGFIYDKDLVKNLFNKVPERYGERNGGYCRVIREYKFRRGDNAELAIIELV